MSEIKKVSFLFLLSSLILSCSSSPQGVIVLCAGDSITESCYPSFLQRMLKKDGIRSKVLNFGRSGYTSGEYLSFLERDKEVLAENKPDLYFCNLEQMMCVWIMTGQRKKIIT